MVNYVCAFSQSELRKYFDWIIIIVTMRACKMLSNEFKKKS